MQNYAPLLLLCFSLGITPATAWVSSTIRQYPGSLFTVETTRRRKNSVLFLAKAGSFFNPVPNSDDEDENMSADSNSLQNEESSFETSIEELLRRRKGPSRASEPSTINGKPTAGFAASKPPQKFVKRKPFVGIGPPLNDVTKPETDDQGYTLYADEVTGEKSRVFEALVDYPCDFTMKIVGANEGSFVQEMVAVVAESCHVDAEKIPHSVRMLGKWTSVTLQAPVQNAEMLYELYETVDRDPRVKFKF